jgi:ATP-dependent DNA helicase RecG
MKPADNSRDITSPGSEKGGTLSFDALRRVLDLECSRDFHDAAVVGGLDRFLANWATQAARRGGPDMIKDLQRLHLLNSRYALMEPEQREAWVKQVLEFLDGLQGVKPKPTVCRPPKAAKPAAPPPPGISLESPVTVLRGISASLAEKFAKFGVVTLRDMLYFFPNRHLDYSQRKYVSELEVGRDETIIANIWQTSKVNIGGRPSTEAIVGDEKGNIRIVWFNNPYLAKTLKTNTRIVVSGRVNAFHGRLQFESPEWEVFLEGELVHTGRLVPIYPLTQGLRQRQVRKLMQELVLGFADRVPEFLPPTLRRRLKLMGVGEAIRQAHYPDDAAHKARARRRLAFDELFILQLGVQARKQEWQRGAPASAVPDNAALLERFAGSLPYELTGAQQRALADVLRDLGTPVPMSRLLQGDVGSGKTVVAAAAMLQTVAAGYQAAIMAPTEILAEQHFRGIGGLYAGASTEVETDDPYVRQFDGLLERPLRLGLLTGGVPAAAKRQLQQRIGAGEIDIVVGTHTLIQSQVTFSKLSLTVIDEQHRFGVEQRAALRDKGTSPHLLVMTATPIPRTLALTLYGDLDLSVIDEMPPGREEIKTKWFGPEDMPRVYKFIRRQVVAGHQAFVICPLVEESEAVAARAATAEYERLSSQVFSDLNMALLHGRMAAKAKDEVMRGFHAGKTDILVSTAVVEVGIDVPNATVMMVESADRFGLSQLHQFRGRVGRGEAQSYCMLITANVSEVARQRLDVIEKTQDGFKLAEADLEMRGPGEFFGTRQSGIPDLRMARLSDVGLLETARAEAEQLFAADPGLTTPEHSLLAAEVARVWQRRGETGESS